MKNNKDKKIPKLEDILYNQSNIENKNIKLDLNLKLKDVRLLTRYLEDELIPGLGNMLGQLEEEEIKNLEIDRDKISSFYSNIYNIFNEIAEISYRGMVEKEKKIIDNLKNEGIPLDGVLEILSNDEFDRQRISNIFEAVDELEFEKNEAKIMKKNLPAITKKIIEQLELDIASLYMPLVIKMVSFLSDTTRSFHNPINEVIFSESALEELLDLDLDALDIFLSKLTKVKVKIGDVEGFLIDDFTIYNNTSLIVYYPIFITNPQEFQVNFSPLNIKELEVSFEA